MQLAFNFEQRRKFPSVRNRRSTYRWFDADAKFVGRAALSETPNSLLCHKCRFIKPETDFQSFLRGRTQTIERQSHCKSCQLVAKNTSVAKNPAKHKKQRHARHLRKMFGLSRTDYQAMLDGQGGVCFICKKPETVKMNGEEVSPLSVDHSHATGKIRALLCGHCNRMIGMAKESPKTLRAAADYLEAHR